MYAVRAASAALRFMAIFVWLGLALVIASPTHAQPVAIPASAATAASDTSQISNPRAADPSVPDFLLWPHSSGPLPVPPGPAGDGMASFADGHWSQILIPEDTNSPHRRVYSSATYDPVRGRIVVFGGLYSYTRFNEVWAFSVTGPPAWNLLDPSGTPPTPRYSSSAVYDPVRDRMLYFGGNDPTGYLNDVWALDLSGAGAWSQLFPSGVRPSGRITNSAIYDPVRDRVLIFGGFDGSFRNDVWALDLSGSGPSWSHLAVAGTPPTPRDGGSSIYDSLRDRMVVFGGWDGSTYSNNAWSLSLSGPETWSDLPAAGIPPGARREQAAIYDPVRDRMVVTGGWGALGGFSDAWALSFSGTATWTDLAPGGTPPTARWGSAAIYDPVADRMDIFAGVDLVDWRNDLYALPLAGPPVWVSVYSPRNGVPWSRDLHLAVYDAPRDRMIMFGGEYGDVLGDLWELGFSGAETGWADMHPAGPSPGPREACAGVYDPEGERLVIFGGYDGSHFHNDVWALSLGGAPAWTALTPVGTGPSPRGSLTASYDPNQGRMILFGGRDAGTPFNDTWALSLRGTPTWTQILPIGGPPPPRAACAQVYDPVRDQLVITGGTTDGTMGYDDAWGLSFGGTPEWHPWTPSGTKPTARWLHATILDPTRDRLLFFGGVDLVDWRNDVWSLSLGASPAWQQLFPDGVPPGRRVAHSAIYDPMRDQLVTFGGRYDLSIFNDTWTLSLSTPTPTLISLASADATGDGVALTWYIGDGAGIEITLERRTDTTDWAALSTTHPDGDGLVRFEDRDVVQGRRYGYRLSFVERGRAKQSGEVWLDVPGGARFSLAGAKPNPATGPFTVSFSIPDASPASLELLDTAGRRLESLEVGGLGPGSHVVRFGAGRPLEPGVYWLRLRRGGRSLSSRVALVR